MLDSCFQDLSPEYQNLREEIQDDLLNNIYSNINFHHYSFPLDNEERKNSFNQDIDFSEDYLLDYLIFYKFIVYNIIIIGNPKKKDPEVDFSSQYANAILCYENECIVIEKIKIELIVQILNKLKSQSTLLNISPYFKIDKETSNEIEAREEAHNFCLHFHKEIKKNELVKLTLFPIASYLIRRQFYPSYYFNDASFFNSLDEENEDKNALYYHLFSLESDLNVRSCVEVISDKVSSLNDIDDENIEITCPSLYFEEDQMIILRTICVNDKFTFYLIIDLVYLHIYLLKKINNLTNLKDLEHEIDFCENYSHRCMNKFIGFLKKKRKIIGFIYEYLCNGPLESYVNSKQDQVSDIFLLMTIIRIFQALEYLNSHSLIHRDLKPSNIFLDHNFLPYIIDFETIIHPREDIASSNQENTNDIGSLLYLSPEQFSGENISYPSDIYSFGLIIYFLIEKKHMKSQDQLSIDSSIPKNKFKLLQNLYQKCVKSSPEERPYIYMIKEIIAQEAGSFNSLRYFQNNDNIENKNEIVQLIYEKVIFFHDNQDEMNKIYNNIFNFQSSFIDNQDDSYSPISNMFGEFYQNGDLVKQDYSKAKEFFNMNNDPESFFNLGNLYAKGKGVEQDYLQAIKYYELSAQQNHPRALFALGICYQHGYGVQQDYLKALKYYELSAELNNSYALNNLGILYKYGLGVEQDFLIAKEYFELSAELENSTALLNLGKLYILGQGIAQDYSRAIKYFKLSADLDNSWGFYYLGEIYLKGQGVKQNLPKAKKYYERSAELNNSEAIYALAIFYLTQNRSNPDFENARKCFEKAAKLGHSKSLVNSGVFYEKGYGVNVDYLKAKYYYELAAGLNNSDALYKLGNLFMHGKGVKQDYAKAKEYFKKSAEQNNYHAFYQLATLYKKGLYVKQNYMKAKEYYQLMAKENSSIGFLKLGNLYKKGHGVEQNYQKVQLFYEISAKLCNPTALFYLSEFYTAGNVFNIDISKAIKYCFKCMQISNWDITRYFSNFIFNKYYYHSMNNLGLIYITVFQDLEKSTQYIKEAALNEYPFAQNNFGLLNQFYLNNNDNAEYMYKRSSKHHFALADFNLGYLKEQNDDVKESIDYYLKASDHEDEPLMFHNHCHVDYQLEISKTFIICLANLKLVDYYLNNDNYEDSKNYFVKALHKIKDEKTHYQFKFHFNNGNKENPFSYIKKYILDFPAFNFVNQPKSNKKETDNLQNKRNSEKDDNLLSKIELDKKINFQDDKINSLQKKNNYLDSDEFKFILKLQKIDSLDRFDNTIMENDEELIFENLLDLFDFVVSSNEIKRFFIEEINQIIHTMQDILYTPPYSILFGRINIEKVEPNEKNIEIKNINDVFYEGFGQI